MALPENLLGDVKNYLDITWTDDASDKKLSGIIARGISYIDGIAGGNQNYSEENSARELLFDYCRYARSHALEDFERNFLSKILTLQISAEVAAYEAENTDI